MVHRNCTNALGVKWEWSPRSSKTLFGWVVKTKNEKLTMPLLNPVTWLCYVSIVTKISRCGDTSAGKRNGNGSAYNALAKRRVFRKPLSHHVDMSYQPDIFSDLIIRYSALLHSWNVVSHSGRTLVTSTSCYVPRGLILLARLNKDVQQLARVLEMWFTGCS
jgi:hypothetical protein